MNLYGATPHGLSQYADNYGADLSGCQSIRGATGAHFNLMGMARHTGTHLNLMGMSRHTGTHLNLMGMARHTDTHFKLMGMARRTGTHFNFMRMARPINHFRDLSHTKRTPFKQQCKCDVAP